MQAHFTYRLKRSSIVTLSPRSCIICPLEAAALGPKQNGFFRSAVTAGLELRMRAPTYSLARSLVGLVSPHSYVQTKPGNCQLSCSNDWSSRKPPPIRPSSHLSSTPSNLRYYLGSTQVLHILIKTRISHQVTALPQPLFTTRKKSITPSQKPPRPL